MSNLPLQGTAWPTARVVTTAQIAALNGQPAQINNLPPAFILPQINEGVLVDVWVRDANLPGSLFRLSSIPSPPQPSSVTVATLGPGTTYCEEYDIAVAVVPPAARVVQLPVAQRNARLVGALMIYDGVAGPADVAGSVVTVTNLGGDILVRFVIAQNTVTGTIVPPTTYDVVTTVGAVQVVQGTAVSLNLSQGDVGFRLVLTWSVVN